MASNGAGLFVSLFRREGVSASCEAKHSNNRPCPPSHDIPAYMLDLTTMPQMAVVIDTEGPADSVTFGDDVVTVETVTDGTVDDIKLELELLSAVGEVSYLA